MNDQWELFFLLFLQNIIFKIQQNYTSIFEMGFVNAKVIAVVLFLVFGTIGTFAYKLQSTEKVNQGDREKNFFHPYMQCLTMFIGEALCLLFYLKNLKQNQLPLQQGKSPHKPWIFFIPAFSDACSSTLQYMGLCFIEGSTYMMFKGASIVTTAIFAKILVNMAIEKRHVFGCGSAIMGIIIVGCSGLIQSDNKGNSTFDKQFIGYIFMTISLIFNGFFYAYEQYLFKKYTINPLQMIGFEGMFGIIIVFILVLMLSFIPCPFGQKACVYNSSNQPFIQLPSVFFHQVFNYPMVLILVIIGIVAIGIYNLNGLKITKLFDALTRSLLNVTKTSVIWVVGIIITLFLGNSNSSFKLESLNIVVNLIKAVGFSFIIFGTLVYNQLICTDCFGAGVKNDKKNQLREIQLVEEIQSNVDPQIEMQNNQNLKQKQKKVQNKINDVSEEANSASPARKEDQQLGSE